MDGIPTLRIAAAVICRDGKYLITQRRPSARHPLLWEFPGGRVTDGELDTSALHREVLRRLGVEIEASALLSYVSHQYQRYLVDIYLYECRIVGGEPQRLSVQDFAWVTSAEFDLYPFTPADEQSAMRLRTV